MRITEVRVAVVEDDAMVATMIQRTLTRARLTVDMFGGAELFLSQLGKQRFDVVVTDLRMPHIDGVELARCVQDLLGSSAPPIVLVTGSLDDLPVDQIARFHAIVQKPFAMGVLVEAVMSAVAPKRSDTYAVTDVEERLPSSDLQPGRNRG